MTPLDKAKKGLQFLKEAIMETLKTHPDGLRNADIARILEIHSDYQGGNKDYLPWSILGLLLNDDKIERKGRKYFLK